MLAMQGPSSSEGEKEIRPIIYYWQYGDLVVREE